MHDHHKPFPPPPPYGPHPPQPLPPDYPHFIPGDYCRPPVPAMPPVPSVVEGESLYEAVNNCIDRVNVCMDTYNSVMAECYKTLHNLQHAAEENGAYYGPADVWTEEGYDADSSAKYFIIHKRHVDRRGQPIFMELGLAYDNATNSKIEQSIFSASKVKYADKIVVAQPKTEKGWYGKAIWHGAPIQADPAANLWTVGFTKGGFMRVYSNGTGVDTMLADTVFNAMGCSGVLIQDGALTSEMYYNQIPDYNKQTSRVIMGQNIATGEVMILVTGHENDVNAKGMTSTAAAEILRQRGVTLAVELCEGESAAACDKGQLMFTPETKTVPTAYCFWYITRRRFYKNDYERELAELMQNYGQCMWEGYLNGEKIQDIAADLAAEIDRAQNAENNLDAAIKAEQARAEAAEGQLNTKIEAETSRAEAAEKALDAKITAETERATAEEARLDAKIDAETERATGVEADLQQQITNEVKRATEAENTLDGKITAETNRAQAREDELDEKIQDETNRATLKEGKLNTKIDTEAQRAKDAEAVLQTNIDNEQQARQDADTALGARIDSLSSDVTQQINDFKTEVNGKLDSMESTINQMQTTVKSLGTQVDNLSQNVTNLSGAVSTMQNTVNTLQQNFTSLTEAVAGINDELDKIQSGDLDLPYLKRGGDTGTGTFNFTGATVNVAAPAADANAATKKYVDDADKVNATAIAAETERATNKENELNTAITAEKKRAEAAESSLSGLINQETTDRKAADNAIKQEIANLTNGTTEMPYVKKSGDTMSGTLNMGNLNIINVAYPNSHADAVNKGYVDTAISGLTDGTTAMPYVKKAGDTMTGALNLPAPTENANAANKKYVDDKDAVLDAAIKKEVQDRETAIEGIQTEIDGVSGDLSGYLPLTGGTMTGALNVQTPTEDANAATKKYVDDALQNATDPELAGRVEALETSQAQQDTEIANLKNGTTALPYIKDTGDTVTGTYDFTGADLTVKAPTADASPATKAYVDSKITNLENGSTALPYVKKAGDSMTGVLNMSNNKVTNVADPTANGDAVNKKYVDDKATETETTLKEYVDGHSGGFENAVIVGLYDMTKTDSIPREANNDYLFIILPKFSNSYFNGMTGTIRNGSNQGVNGYEQQIGASDGQFTFTGDGYVMVYRVAVTPSPVDPATKFNQIDLNNYVGGLSGSTVNTASDFNAALQYILDNNSGKHFYYGTDHTGTTWYFASDTELSALSNDSYTCGNGVQNNGKAVQETFKIIKVHGTIEFPPPGYTRKIISQAEVSAPSTGTIDEAFEYVDAAPGPRKYYDNDASFIFVGVHKCFAKLHSSDSSSSYSGRIAYYDNDTWKYGEGACLAL